MAGTSRSDDDHPTPQGGGAAERLREFRAARGEPVDDETIGAPSDTGTTTTDEMTPPSEGGEPSEGGDGSSGDRTDGP